MVSVQRVADAVGKVLDPHLPIGLQELGMLESVEALGDGGVSIVIAMPCHHCPGMQQMYDEIVAQARVSGARGEVRVSFHGQEVWQPLRISPRARTALRAFGVQVGPSIEARES